MTNPNICKICDSKNRSCCTLRAENNEGLPFPISEPEIIRILNVFEDKKRYEVTDKKANSVQFTGQMKLLFPDMADQIHNIFPANGTHFELKTVKDKCVFKSTDGCILPDDDRPLFCRLYPFWILNGEPHIFQDANCLALERNQTVPEIFLSLGTTPDRLKHLYAAMCKDWRIDFTIPKKQRLSYNTFP